MLIRCCLAVADYLNPSSELPPHFLSTPVDVSVREGGMAVLPCAVQYLGPRQVTSLSFCWSVFLRVSLPTFVSVCVPVGVCVVQ